MLQPQDIQSCIRDCENVANRLRNIANQVQDQRSRYMLTEAVRHAEECISGCNMSMMLTRQQGTIGTQFRYQS